MKLVENKAVKIESHDSKAFSIRSNLSWIKFGKTLLTENDSGIFVYDFGEKKSLLLKKLDSLTYCGTEIVSETGEVYVGDISGNLSVLKINPDQIHTSQSLELMKIIKIEKGIRSLGHI